MLRAILFTACFVFSSTSFASISALANRLDTIDMPHIRLDFKEYVAALPNAKQRVVKQRALRQLLDAVKTYKTNLNDCEKLQITQLKNAVERQLEVLALVEKFGKPNYQTGFFNLKEGQQWYAFWRKAWLQESISTEQLKVIAERELSGALTYLNSHSKVSPRYVDYQDATTIVKRFNDIEKTLSRTLEREFGLSLNAVNAVTVSQSTMARDFPAPGYYNPALGRFYYHSNNQTFDLNSAVWLYLHEASPGHHFQSQLALQNKCDPVVPSLIFSEGWAAYVESTAAQLSAITQPGEANYIWQWQALRAMRVLIDIGIHQQGWSDQQAFAYWQSRLPHTEPHIVKREINRIRNWPVQVITYVYGKHRVLQTLQRLRKQHQITLTQAHKMLLQNQIIFNERSPL